MRRRTGYTKPRKQRTAPARGETAHKRSIRRKKELRLEKSGLLQNIKRMVKRLEPQFLLSRRGLLSLEAQLGYPVRWTLFIDRNGLIDAEIVWNKVVFSSPLPWEDLTIGALQSVLNKGNHWIPNDPKGLLELLAEAAE